MSKKLINVPDFKGDFTPPNLPTGRPPERLNPGSKQSSVIGKKLDITTDRLVKSKSPSSERLIATTPRKFPPKPPVFNNTGEKGRIAKKKAF